MPAIPTGIGSQRSPSHSSKEDLSPAQVRAQFLPNRRLPYDILCEIFKNVCAPPKPKNQAYSPAAFPPTRLGAVSTYWRHVAWSTPHLWTYLVLTKSFWLSKHRMKVLDLYFTNMRGKMLDLAFEDPPVDDTQAEQQESPPALLDSHDATHNNPQFPACEVFDEIFVRHLDKLKSVAICDCAPSWLDEIVSISETRNLPHLTAFRVYDNEYFWGYGNIENWPVVIRNAPLLNSVTLMGLRDSFSFPWEQITYLDFRSLNTKHALQAVLQCINLEYLSIAGLRDVEDEDEDMLFPLERVVLSRLVFFELIGIGVPDFWDTALVDHLAFPALAELILVTGLQNFDRHPDFLYNLPTTLTCLKLHFDYGHTAAFTNLLELFPRWETLSNLTLICDMEASLRLSERLIVKPNVPNMLPALTQLDLTISTSSNHVPQHQRFLTILELVRSRWVASRPDGVERIQKFVLSFPFSKSLDLENWPEKFKSGIKELVDEGLDVSVVAFDHRVTAPWLERS